MFERVIPGNSFTNTFGFFRGRLSLLVAVQWATAIFFHWTKIVSDTTVLRNKKITEILLYPPNFESVTDAGSCYLRPDLISVDCMDFIGTSRLRMLLKFWSATMFEAVARNFGPLHNLEPPTSSVPRATRVIGLSGDVTGHMMSHMVPIAWCRHHIGKFSLWTTLLQLSRSAQISLFSNFSKLGQLFFDNIFFGLTRILHRSK